MKPPSLFSLPGPRISLEAIGVARTLHNVTVDVVDCCERSREEQMKNRPLLRMPQELLGKLPIFSTDNIGEKFAIIGQCSVWLVRI